MGTYTYTSTDRNQSSIFRMYFSQRSPYFKRESYRSNCYLLLSTYLQKILIHIQKILAIDLLRSVVKAEVRRLFSPWITHKEHRQHSQQTLLELIIILQYQIRISSITLVNVYVYIPTHRLNATIICIAVIEWTRGTNSYIKPVAILSLQATYYIS